MRLLLALLAAAVLAAPAQAQENEDVLVVSFDDAPVARLAARSLTSVAQPMDQMADRALSDLLTLMKGGQVEPVTRLGVSLVLRESCSCGYIVRRSSVPPLTADGAVLDYLRENRAHLSLQLQPSSGSSRTFWPLWASRLLDALEVELETSRGSFLRVLEEIAEEAGAQEMPIDELSRAIAQLRREFHEAGFHGDKTVVLEKIWMKALTILSAAATRLEGRTAMDLLEHAHGLRHASQRLSIALESVTFASELRAAFGELAVKSGFVGLCSGPDAPLMQPLVQLQRAREAPPSLEPYPVGQLLPDGFPDPSVQSGLIVMALTFEREVLGLLALDSSVDPFVCESLRSQISASLKLGALHRRVVEETALAERLGQEQLRGEMAIARRIQTALAPKDLAVPALEICGGINPADQVGGDYYDVLPAADGCWLGMGDVTGHGLLSGLIMLMLQSVVSALASARPHATPAELVVELNKLLVANIRHRMGENQHVTFMLLRYFSDGRLQFAGAHEELIVYRARDRRCETIDTTGMWLGITDDIAEHTIDQELRLEPNDLLILYTDGLIEARNAVQEQYGLKRLQELVVAHAQSPVEAIHAKLMRAAADWSAVQQDDITCLVARYTPHSRGRVDLYSPPQPT